ncbi:3'-5' exonuclease [Serratia sp. PF2-63]|uniref:3'-5' exonuclease n=1 Tax=Serratia TaxID=613 RepID=UPI00217AA1E6|nr:MULTISPECIES: 3'-5' exonuclease [Serratia]MDI6973392.1 3'-5' exonuclease [Serratia sp. Se-RSBMAAmG]MDI9262361.1 3'-5' exonuclease [Serratia sp. PF2-63]MDI9271213.1 3'-5' exonuclease [Serratia sp. PF-27]CAI1531405.1 Exodeoxyribonuclease 10 [Serratia marcescens]
MTPQQHAQLWLDKDMLILDTESTGLGDDDEIVEICLVDNNGFIMLNTLIKPTKPIPTEATAIHGITDEMVAHAPTWRDVHGAVSALFFEYRFVIYNAAFDARMIIQSARLHGLGDDGLCSFIEEYSRCAMLAYAEYYGQESSRGGYKWQKLTAAAEQQGITVVGTPHRALSDCLTTLGIIKAMAEGAK